MIDDLDYADLLRLQSEDVELFETVIRRIYQAVVEPGDYCVDGGACKGLHTFALSKIVGPQGRVFAFEPVAPVANALGAALCGNGVKNVVLSHKALFNKRATVSFKYVRNAPSRSGIVRTSYPYEPDIKEISVEAVQLDEALSEVPTLRFCKLDLEGAEFRALQGAEGLLRNHAPLVIFERSLDATTWYGYSWDEFFAFFDGMGCSLFDLFGRRLDRQNANDAGRPWYAIAAKRASDLTFLERRLPELLREVLDRYRNPIPAWATPPSHEGPFIWAAPNPIPAGEGPGTTFVHWSTGDDSVGEIYVSVNDTEERLFYKSAKGVRSAPWINPWGTYDFRLYDDSDRSKLLAALSVSRRKR